MELLQLHNATKSFKNKQVVKEVALEIQRGSITGLFGRNGSGKSTLLKMLFGTLKADTISVSIDGKKVHPKEHIPNQIIAYAPQHDFLPKYTKVRDIIPMFHTSEAAQDAVFYDSHIAKMTHKTPATLSLGELKYVEVVLLTHLPHPFLLLDEPFSMLEPLHKEQLQNFLMEQKKSKGILVTDHYYHDVLSISNTNYVLNEGVSHLITSEDDLRAFYYLTAES